MLGPACDRITGRFDAFAALASALAPVGSLGLRRNLGHESSAKLGSAALDARNDGEVVDPLIRGNPQRSTRSRTPSYRHRATDSHDGPVVICARLPKNRARATPGARAL
jgi:hypothetical protein